jgi:murein DD-endopeptidase MepM/ murein hydrolase activator NlpD
MGRGIFGGLRRRALALGLAATTVVGAVAVAPPAARAETSDAQIAAAQKKLDAARTAAHDAALAYLRAEHQLARIEDELADLEAQLPRLRAKVAAAREAFDANAVALYTGSITGPEVAGGLFGAEGAMDVARVTKLASSTTLDASTSLDSLRAAERELEARERETREQRLKQRQVTAEMQQHSTDLGAAMREAGKELRKLQAQQAVEKYWAAIARQEAARQAAEAAAAAAAAANQTPPPTTTGPGRRSGPADPDLAATVPVEDLLCPVQAPVTFVDDWGQPRSGWRVHEGTDVFNDRDSPNVAVADGIAIQRPGNLAGNGLRLVADDGHMYFYAHLGRYEGTWVNGQRRVKKGDVVGYSGNTGNAAGGPVHTHFEIHPGGKAPIDPYPALREMCRSQLGLDDPATEPPAKTPTPSVP